MVELKSTADSKQEAFVLNCNKLAMDHLHADRPAEALTLLLKAETQVRTLPASASQVKLKSITLNNLGCFYKRAAQPQLALDYLEAALDLDVTSVSDRTNLAGTHLNICAIKSQIGSHNDALSHAFAALSLLKVAPSELTPNLLTTIVIAHHNAGVELEHLQQVQQAVDVYREGLEVSKENLGPEHPLTVSLHKSYFQALENVVERGEGRTGKKKFLSVTPAPGKTDHFQPKKKPPRRSASKGAYDYYQKPSTSPTSRLGQLSRSFDETQDSSWPDVRSTPEDEYRIRSKPSSKSKKLPAGLQLQPLQVLAPLSKQSRRQKSFSAPDKSKPVNAVSPSRSKLPAKSSAFRRTQRKKPNSDRIQLNSVMKVLNEKLALLEEKVDRIPRTAISLRKGKSLEVVNIVGEEVISGKRAIMAKIVEGLKVGLARKTVKAGGGGKLSVEKRAQAAIEALERLKKEAMEETAKSNAPAIPKSKPPPRPDPARRLKFARNTKSRPLDPIPEAKIESKSERKRGLIVKIQSYVRMFLCRRRLLKMRKAVMILQRWTRMTQTRRLFLGIKAAIQLIQTWWRITLVRRHSPLSHRPRLSL